MDGLDHKTIKTSRGYTISYYTSGTSHQFDPNLPGLLFLHGFPDDAHLWQFIVPKLLQLPYRIVLPDLLGSGESSKPSETSAYRLDEHTQDLIEALDAEAVQQAIVGGHDWGSNFAQRVYLYHPDRIVGMILLNVGYMPPSPDPFDLDAVNSLTEQVFGYPVFVYWEFFTAPDAAEVFKKHPDRAWEVWHGDVDDWMKKMFCVRDAIRNYLEKETESVPLKPYAKNPALREPFMRKCQKEGLEGALNYYRAHKTNVQYEAEKKLPPGREVVKIPVLFIGCTNDSVCRPDSNTQPKAAGLLPDLEEVVIESAHWSPFEKPDEIATAITAFLKKRFPASA